LNCGVGMIICVGSEEAARALKVLEDAGEQPWIIGSIERADEGAEPVALYRGSR
jgi:phosphoribosylformylglycinamidine cyclo-ligase